MAETTKVTETTAEAPVVRNEVWLAVAAGAALVLGVLFFSVGLWIMPEQDDAAPLNAFIPFVLSVAGVMLGAGLGFLLGEVRKTTVTKTTETSKDDLEGVAGPELVISESFKILKDLTPGKTLVVLAVALIGLALWSVTPESPESPEAPDTETPGETQ